MGMPTKQQIADICRKHRIGFLVVFGSMTQDERAARDTDVAVSFGRRPSAREELDLFYDMERIFATDKLDLVVLEKADPVLMKEVALHGIPLFEREKGAFDNFIIGAIARYQDTNQNRRLANELVGEYLRGRRLGA
jgi:predicted nucleotidyltransferase